MNKTTVLWVGILSVLGFTACNYTDGLCYLQEDLEGYEGAGGGVIVPGGEGGFGDAPPTPQAADPEGFECNAVGGYSASLFKFTTTIPDDGTDKGGGSQEASATLKFVDGRQTPPQSWTCSILVQLPLRTELCGVISPSKAAEMSADVATLTGTLVMHSRDSWLPALFCDKFKKSMVKNFDQLYPGCGGRVR